ncbi:MAG: flippase [Clostridia bacterium]|nr:flippase [Clostridia bacterium]
MNPYKKLRNNTLILGAGTFISKVMVFFLMPLYTAYLSKSEYGTGELIMQTCNLIIPFACVGISTGLFRFAADKEEDRRVILASGFVVQLIGSAVFALIMTALLVTGWERQYVWLVLLYVLAANYQALFAQFIRAQDKTRLFSVQGILNTGLVILFNVLFLTRFEMGMVGYVLSVIVANVITTVFILFAGKVWKEIHFSLADRKVMRRLVRYSLPMVLSTIFWWVTDISDHYFVRFMIGEDANGLYAAAYKIPTILVLIASIFNEAWQLSAIMGQNDEKMTREMYSKIYRGYMSLSVLACSGLIFLCRIISRILLDESFGEAWVFMPVLLIATVFTNLDTFLGSVYQLRKKPLMSFVTSFFGAALNVVMNFILIPVWGAMGAAVATALSYFIVWVLRTIDVRRLLRFEMQEIRIVLNLILLSAQAALMILEKPAGWYGINWAQALLLAAVVAFNLPYLLKNIRMMFENRRRKKPEETLAGTVPEPAEESQESGQSGERDDS